MGVVQLDPIKTRLLGTPRSGGKQARQHDWQLLNVEPLRVGDALACAHVQGLPFARVQHGGPLRGFHLTQVRPHVFLAPILCTQSFTQTRGDAQKPLEKFGGFGAAANVEKVNDLDQGAGLTLAFAVNGLHQAL